MSAKSGKSLLHPGQEGNIYCKVALTQETTTWLYEMSPLRPSPASILLPQRSTSQFQMCSLEGFSRTVACQSAEPKSQSTKAWEQPGSKQHNTWPRRLRGLSASSFHISKGDNTDQAGKYAFLEKMQCKKNAKKCKLMQNNVRYPVS